MTLRYIADNEIHKSEREISVLCDLLHSEIDSIESISAIDKKLEYLSQSDRVLKQIDSIALSINEQKVFANIDLLAIDKNGDIHIIDVKTSYKSIVDNYKKGRPNKNALFSNES